MPNAKAPIPQLMTVAEAAEYLGVSLTVVRRLASNRQITHYRIGIAGGTIRFDRDDLEEFIQQRGS